MKLTQVLQWVIYLNVLGQVRTISDEFKLFQTESLFPKSLFGKHPFSYMLFFNFNIIKYVLSNIVNIDSDLDSI